MSKHSSEVHDLVVIGCGISGLSCAVAAQQAGLQPIVLERASSDEFGGNTRWTESYWRMKNAREVSDDFEEQLAANAGYNIDPNVVAAVTRPYDQWPSYVKAHGMTDPELISTLASGAPATVEWLQSFGVRFDSLATYFMTAAAPRMMPVGGGLALIEALRAEFLRRGGRIEYETTATDLQAENDGTYHLRMRNSGSRFTVLQARTVMIASGGFEGNPEMMAQYMGSSAAHIRPVARGGYYNRGEGIRLALSLGAAPAGDFSSFHAEPLDPRSRQPEALVMNFPYGILVNRRGERFTDEAPGPVDIHYDHISRDIKDQPDGIAFVVFDERMHDVPNWRKSIRTDQPPISAGSLDELAKLCDVSAEGLTRTVSEYNTACQPGTFKPLETDGLSTQGLRPEKSNWARPIGTPPFHAFPIIAGVCFTYGGVKTDSHARVVDGDGRCIPGLYAAGEAAGLYHQVYTGATSVMRGAVFGRIAGSDAAAFCRNPDTRSAP